MGLALRVFAAVVRIDRHWPDEHYQTLEPAFFLLRGEGVLTWEWLHGFRSWTLPAAHWPMLFIGDAAGLSGASLTTLARVAHGALDVWGWRRWLEFVCKHSALPSEASKQTALHLSLGAAMLLPSFVLWGVATLQDHLASALLWGSLPTALTLVEGNRPWRWALFGALVTLPTLFKLQLAPLCAGVALSALHAKRRDLAATQRVAALAGALSIALASATIDHFTFGSFACSTVRQLRDGERLSRLYGTQPPSFYLLDLPTLVGEEGLAFGALLAIVALLALAQRMRTRARLHDRSSLTRHTPLAIVAPGAALFALFLCAIPHKETRFALPLLGFAVPALCASGAATRIDRWLETRAPSRRSRLALILCVVCAAFSAASVRSQPIAQTHVDLSPLEEHIRRHRGPSRIRLCLVQVHWTNLRGSLGVDGPVTYVQLDTSNTHDALRCDWLIAPTEWTSPVEARLRFSAPLATARGFTLRASAR